MELNIDVTGKEFIVTRDPAPKLDASQEQRTDKATGLPTWSTQVCVTDNTGGEIINISTAGDKPQVYTGEDATVEGLIAIAWHTNGRSGIAYKATTITPPDPNG